VETIRRKRKKKKNKKKIIDCHPKEMFKKRLKRCAKFQKTGCFCFSLKTLSPQAKSLTCCSHHAFKDICCFLILTLSNQLSWAQSGFCPSLGCMKLLSPPSRPLTSLVGMAPSHGIAPSRRGAGETPVAYWHPPAPQLGRRNEASLC